MSLLRLCFLWLSLSAWSTLALETLTVYTHSTFAAAWGPGPTIKKAFEAQYHCQVRFVTLDGSCSLLNRLKLEGKNSHADVIVGLDSSLLKVARQTTLFAPHNVDTRQVALPGGWRDRYFVPYDYAYLAFVYNSHSLTRIPQSLKELVESAYPWRLIYADPRTSSLGFKFLQWMRAVYGQKSALAWQQLARKSVTVTKNWSEAYSLFLKGEADLVLSYTSSPAYHSCIQQDRRYQAALFSEDQPLQVEVAAKLASSRQPLLADQFMRFLLSPAMQALIPTTHWVYPVIQVPLPEHFSNLPKPQTILTLDEPVTAQERQQWVRTWRSAVINH